MNLMSMNRELTVDENHIYMYVYINSKYHYGLDPCPLYFQSMPVPLQRDHGYHWHIQKANDQQVNLHINPII